MGVLTIARHPGKANQRIFSVRFHQRGMTDERDRLQLSEGIPRAIEGSTVARTKQAVVTNQTRHENGMKRTRGKKFEHFGFVMLAEFDDCAWVRRLCVMA